MTALRRVLILSSLYAPFQRGGAEVSSRNFARWLTGQGHQVAVLTTAPTRADELWRGDDEGVTIYRVFMPRGYTMFDAERVAPARKAMWHLRDHFDPFNTALARRVIADFRPDVVNVKIIQGLGYNMLGEFARARLPLAYSLHDLGLGCINMSRFRNGRACTGHCTPCRASAANKRGLLRRIERLSFISPSAANLKMVDALLPIADRPGYVIPNPNSYPAAAPVAKPEGVTRFLYAGRLHASKGIDVVIEALAPLAQRSNIMLSVVGSGPDEASLRARYGHLGWIEFAGHVSVTAVSAAMAASDALLVPSIWQENSPGVVLQAQGLGLPVVASRVGGIPELVNEGVDALLLPAGDVPAWREALARLIDDPAHLERMRAATLAAAPRRDPEVRARKMWEVLETTIDPDAPTPTIEAADRLFPRHERD